MIGRIEIAAIVEDIDNGRPRCRIVGAWLGDRSLPELEQATISNSPETTVQPGERIVSVEVHTMHGRQLVGLWSLADCLAIAPSGARDDNPERTGLLLNWCCPLCEGDLGTARHECPRRAA